MNAEIKKLEDKNGDGNFNLKGGINWLGIRDRHAGFVAGN